MAGERRKSETAPFQRPELVAFLGDLHEQADLYSRTASADATQEILLRSLKAHIEVLLTVAALLPRR